VKGKTFLYTYFGDFSLIGEELLDFPVDGLGVDFQETPLKKLAGTAFNKELAAGIVDARNSLLEEPQEIAALALEIEEKLFPPSLFLCPNCELEYLPLETASKKLCILAEATALAKKGV
jgi:5-methyltetrahydropteroyltriglutamate--homocysteine methyltransferase